MAERDTDEACTRSFPAKLSDALRNPQQKPKKRRGRHVDIDARLFDAAMFVSAAGATFEEAAVKFLGDPAKWSDVDYQFYLDFRESSTDRKTPYPFTCIEGVLAGGYQICNVCGKLIEEGEDCLAAQLIGRIERPENPPTRAWWDFLCEECARGNKKKWKKRWNSLLKADNRFLLSGGKPPADDLGIYAHALCPCVLKDMPPGAVAMARMMHSYDFGHVRMARLSRAYIYEPVSEFCGGKWRSTVPCNLRAESWKLHADGMEGGVFKDEHGKKLEKQFPRQDDADEDGEDTDDDVIGRLLIRQKSGASRNGGKTFLPCHRFPSPDLDVPVDCAKEYFQIELPVTQYRPVECSQSQINELAKALAAAGVFPPLSDFDKLAARAVATLAALHCAVDARAPVWRSFLADTFVPSDRASLSGRAVDARELFFTNFRLAAPRRKSHRSKGHPFVCEWDLSGQTVDFPLYKRGELDEFMRQKSRPAPVNWPPPAEHLPSPLESPWLYALDGNHFVLKPIRKIPHEVSGKKIKDRQKHNGLRLKGNFIRGWMVYPLNPRIVNACRTPTSEPCWWGRLPQKRRIRDSWPFVHKSHNK